MRMRDVVSALVGGGAIYLAMAACAASEKGSPGHQVQQNAGGSGQGAEGGAYAQQTSGGSGQGAEGGTYAQQTSGGSGAQSNAGSGGDGGLMDMVTDPVPDASADPVSGSRLKARYRTTEDGAKVYDTTRWFDSERRELCAFSLAGDGKERCLPSPTDAPVVYVYYFADSSCTHGIAYYSKGCAPKYAYQSIQTATSCPSSGGRVFPVGARLNATSIYVIDNTGACIAQTPLEAFDYFALGDEIPPSSFVAATWAVDP